MISRNKIRYYSSFSDDFVKADEERFKKIKDGELVQNRIDKALSSILYYFLLFFSCIYLRVFLHTSYVNRKKLNKHLKKGGFIYGNHTQSIGDAFIPAHILKGRRFGAVISRENLAIRGIGPVLTRLGGIPLPSSVDTFGGFKKMLKGHVDKGEFIVIYPEAHVWDYYTDIRPFDESSFLFPARYNKPVYCFTTTYHKRRFFKKPKIKVFVDGPFYADSTLGFKERAVDLRNKVYNTMKERAKLNSCEYIKYVYVSSK